MSLPNASTIRASSSTIPIICITTRKRSLGLRPVIISYRVNMIWPPSSAGIGSRFIIPSITESSASMLRKRYQSHASGNTCPMAMKLPTDL